jgi:lysophospholipase L1-like esterase
MTGRRVGGGLAAALIAAVIAATPGLAESPDSDPLHMSYQERVRDHQDREDLIKKRISEAEDRWRRGVGLPPGERSLATRGTRSDRGDYRAREALGSFYAALQSYERGGRRGRLVILQIGDSHTAGENWTGYLRERFQRRFGDGGRGILAPGKPFADYHPYQIRVAQNGPWGIYSYRQWAGTGITSYAIVGDKSEDSFEASMQGLKTFDQVEVEYVRQTDGGSFAIDVDGRTVRTVSARGRPSLERVVVSLPRPGYDATVTLKGNGPVAIISWTLVRRNGLVFDSLGVPGETIGLLGKWNREIAAWQIAHLNPALIIVAFGTNDGFVNKLQPAEYEANLTEKLREIRSMAPNASIAVVGAPDADRLPSWCARTQARRERFHCRALDPRQAENYAELIDKRSRALCYWHSPPALNQVRAIQRKVAARLGMWFWDWSKLMGQPCGMDRWARMDPPFAVADRVHMRVEGYDLSGEALYRDLMQLYSPGRR